LQNPYSDAQTVSILTNLVKLAGLKDAYIWWAVTRGQMQNEDRTRPRYTNRFYAFVTPYSFILHDETRTRGASVMVSEQFERISPRAVDPTAKNFHWMDMKLSIFEALRAGADWSVLTDGNGNLTEAAGLQHLHREGRGVAHAGNGLPRGHHPQGGVRASRRTRAEVRGHHGYHAGTR
jgi:branched-chain amino acid aminotransferase